MTFPNGLPKPGELVEVQTIWDDDWHPLVFQKEVSRYWPEKGRYAWFGCYAAPDPETGSGPIVISWRYPKEEAVA